MWYTAFNEYIHTEVNGEHEPDMVNFGKQTESINKWRAVFSGKD